MTSRLYQRAVEYLRLEFAPEREFSLTLVKETEKHPLHGPGVNEVYTFNSAQGVNTSMAYYLVAARPGAVNYYPLWGLSPDDIWAVHVASEFYLSMGVEPLPATTQERRFRHEAEDLVRRQWGSPNSASPVLEQVFRLKPVQGYAGEYHAVGKLTHGKERWAFVVGDVAHALYPLDIPSHAVWRLHLGRQILAE
jgi:hypothetical protein